MELRKTHAAAALALAGALVAATATPSFSDNRWGYAAGGFVAGAVIGAAAANANAGYYYSPGYRGYAYAPSDGYAYAPAPSYGPAYYSYGYAPGYSSFSYRPIYDPENGNDPDGRIGGSFKMNSSGDD